jgi:drug/metabolite transporter (DMT)-like permease
MKPRTISLLELNIAVLLWGGTAMFAKGLKLPVVHIICLRSLVAGAALLLFMLCFKKSFKLKHPWHWGVMGLIGLLLCLHWLAFFQALKISTAAVAILSMHTYPVFTALLEPFLFGEKLKKADLLLAAAVFSGVIIMTPEISLSNETTQGILLGIVAGLFFMARNLMTRKYVKEYSSSALMFWQVLVTGVLLLPVLFLSGETEIEHLPSTIWLFILLGTVFTALPHALFSASFKHLSAKTAGILATLLPLYGAIFGYLIHKETVAPRTAIGGLLVLVCIVLETLRTVKQPSGHQQTPQVGPTV